MTTPPVVAPPTVVAPQEPDRSGWLIGFGIFELLIACMIFGVLAILLLSLLITTRIPNHQAMPIRMVIQAVMTYVGIFAFFIVMGIGSIKARRWARSLMVAVSWLWLIGGVFGILMYAYMLPRALRQTGPELPQSVALIMTVIMLVFMFGALVLLPGIMLIFYRSQSVKATCERVDTATRWTDHFAEPMLILFVMFVTGAASFFVIAFTMPYLTLFGRFITGLPASIGCLALSGLWVFLAYGTYHRKMSAWWTAVIAMCILGVSAVPTFLRGDATKMYVQMGMPAQQSAVSAALIQSPVMIGLMVGIMIAFLGYLIYVRKYFGGTPSRVN